MADESRSGPAEWSTISGALAGPRLDWTFTGLALLMIGGIAWDFHVHAGGISFAEEGFFTPSHLTFYSAFVVIVGLLAVATVANYRRGDPLLAAIPTGYRLGILGAGLFVLGGPADLLWHTAFGFEVGVEALTSPSHLLLVVGATLFLSSPLRAAWVRREPPAGIGQVPLLISATFVAVGVSFFTIYQNPLVQPVGAPGGPSPDHSFLGVLWFAAIVAALALSLVRRFRLAPGAFTLVLGLLGLLVTAVIPSFEFLPAMVATGIVTDGLYYAVQDTWPRARVVRLIGAAIPTVLFALYFATVALLHGLGWSLHVWLGGIVSAGLVGLLVSYVVLPTGRSVGEAEGTGTPDVR